MCTVTVRVDNCLFHCPAANQAQVEQLASSLIVIYALGMDLLFDSSSMAEEIINKLRRLEVRITPSS